MSNYGNEARMNFMAFIREITSVRHKQLKSRKHPGGFYDKNEEKKCKAGGRVLDKSEHTKYQHYLNRTPFISQWLRDHKDLLDANDPDNQIILDQINQEGKNNG